MIEIEFLKSVIKRFEEEKSLGNKTFEQLSEEQFHQAPTTCSNSIAIIIQHLHGNMLSRWTNFLTEDGEKEWRKRDEEFEQHVLSRKSLISIWEEGWKALFDTLHSIKPEDLQKTITIRTQPLIVIDAINRQLAHYSYHVGQIVQLGKWLKNDDWQSLSIPKGASKQYNQSLKQGIKS